MRRLLVPSPARLHVRPRGHGHGHGHGGRGVGPALPAGASEASAHQYRGWFSTSADSNSDLDAERRRSELIQTLTKKTPTGLSLRMLFQNAKHGADLGPDGAPHRLKMAQWLQGTYIGVTEGCHRAAAAANRSHRHRRRVQRSSFPTLRSLSLCPPPQPLVLPPPYSPPL